MQHFYSLSVTVGVRPFPLAMQHFYSFVSRSVTAGVCPFPLGMQHVYSFVSGGLSLVLPPFSAGHAAFLFICLPCNFLLFVFQVWCLRCCFLLLEQVRL